MINDPRFEFLWNFKIKLYIAQENILTIKVITRIIVAGFNYGFVLRLIN